MSQGINLASIYVDLRANSRNLERGLSEARRAVQAAHAELRRLDEELNEGAIGQQAYAARTGELTNTINGLRAAMQSAYAAAPVTNGGLGAMGAGMQSAQQRAMAFSMSLMQLGSAIDDVQYGFRGVLNNLPMLASGLAQAAGASIASGNMIAAGVAIAATAAYQLYEHWSELMDVLGMNANIRTAAEEMKKLGDQTARTANEEKRYQELKAEEANQNTMAGDRPKEERSAQRQVQQAIAQQGPGPGGGLSDVATGVMPFVTAASTPAEDFEQWEIDHPNERLSADFGAGIEHDWQYLPGHQGEIKSLKQIQQDRLRKKRQQRRETQAREWVEQAATDPQRLQALIQRIENDLKQNKGKNFGGKAKAEQLLKELKAATPEGIEAAKTEDERLRLGLMHPRDIADKDKRRQAEQRDARQAAEEVMANQQRGFERDRMLADRQQGVGPGKGVINDKGTENDIAVMLRGRGYRDEEIKRLMPLVKANMERKLREEIRAEQARQGGAEEAAAERLRVRQEQQELRPLGLIRSRDIKDPDAQRHAYQQEASKAAGQMMANRKIREKLLTDQNANIDNEIRALLTAANYDKNEIEKMLPMVRGIMGHTVEQDITKELGAHGGDAKEAAERLKAQSAAQGGPSSAQARAIAANRELRQQVLRGQKVTDDDVAKAMKAAGYTDDQIKAQATQFRDEMERGIAEEKQERASRQNITEGEAGTRIADEEEYRRKHALQSADRTVRSATEHLADAQWSKQQRILDHNKPQFMGLAEYAKKLAVGGFETQKWQHEMLLMNRGIRDATENVVTAIEASEQAKSTYD